MNATIHIQGGFWVIIVATHDMTIRPERLDQAVRYINSKLASGTEEK